MPILAAEPNVYPEDLFGPVDGSGPRVEGRLWRVLHTRPRQEKGLARDLWQARVPYYLPLASRRMLIRGRPATSYLPLFPGYLFLLSSREEYLRALATRRVVRALEVGDQAGLADDLRQVHRLIASGLPVAAEARLVPGAVVEITSGPLAGLRGKILREASGRRFLVQVNFIQQGASVLLADYHLEALPGGPGLDAGIG